MLFQVNGVGGDLLSFDMVKARDLGINPYVDYLHMIGKKYPTTWKDLEQYMPHNVKFLYTVFLYFYFT